MSEYNEPWCEDCWAGICDNKGNEVACNERIIACVNACAGIPTEALPNLRQLLAALELARDALDNVQGDINPERGYADELEVDVSSALDQARAAIARLSSGGAV